MNKLNMEMVGLPLGIFFSVRLVPRNGHNIYETL